MGGIIPVGIAYLKTLHVYIRCARILSGRSTNTGNVEKWATPTFLLVKNKYGALA